MLKSVKLILIISLYIFSTNSAQYVRITKILNSNLFELQDGTKIKMAGIDAPQLESPIPFFQEVAKDATFYSTENLLTRQVFIEPLPKDSSQSYNLVFIKYNYLFQEVNYNQKFLLNGYGKFIDNVNGKYKTEILESEDHARNNKKGIWEYYKTVSTDTLDQDLTASGIVQLAKMDSIEIKSQHKPRPIYISLPLELLVGSISTVITGIASGALFSAIVQPHGEYSGFATLGFGILIGYTIGFSSGVYFVASYDNPNLSYWTTIGSSLGLTLVTSGISALVAGKNDYHFTRFIALLSPIIGPLLYVHAFPPAYPTREDFIPKNSDNVKIESFKDYYNTTMNFRMELIRIYF